MRNHAAQIGSRVVVLAALLALLVATAASGAGCGSKSAAQQADVRAALTAASAALVSHDAAAWFLALPSGGKAAQSASYQTYSGLSRFPWAQVSAKAVPVGDMQGRYRVRFYGRLKGSDTSPLVCERILDFIWRQGRLKMVADRTNEWSRDTYYLAFSDPVVTVRRHIVVVGERWQKRLIRRIAACDGQARRVATRLRLDANAPQFQNRTLVYVCASGEQAWKASDSRPDKRMAGAVVDKQVYAIGESPAWWKSYSPDFVRHELAHVYADDFGDGKHFVGLLVEGLAVAVEGNYDFSALRTEVASGNRILPLKKTLMHEHLWRGFSGHHISLAYLEGGALVRYLWKRWGFEGAWAFADAVAASDMTPAGIEQATSQSLGVTWSELYRGWKRFVRTLP
jgi:hypothetical protein